MPAHEHRRVMSLVNTTEIQKSFILIFLALVCQYTNCAINYVNHILCLICDVESKSLADNTMPSSTKLLIQTCLDELRCCLN